MARSSHGALCTSTVRQRHIAHGQYEPPVALTKARRCHGHPHGVSLEGYLEVVNACPCDGGGVGQCVLEVHVQCVDVCGELGTQLM